MFFILVFFFAAKTNSQKLGDLKHIGTILKFYPDGANGKEPTCHCRKHKRHGFDPWVRKIALKKEMTTHFSILAWKMPWTEAPGGPWSIGLQSFGYSPRVRHGWST